MLLFAPKASLELATRVADALGVCLSPSEEREFDGGEHKMRSMIDVRSEDVFVVHSLHGDAAASANDKLCRLLFFAGALKDAGAERVTAVTPYLAYARKDRRTQPRDPVTTRYVAAMMEAAGIDRTVTLEIHNEAAFDNAFRHPAVRLDAVDSFAPEIAREVRDQPVIVMSPDIGGVKRAQRLGECLAGTLSREIDLAFMEKRRAKGVLSGETVVGDLDGRAVVIYDDLIASGSTILRAAQAARRAGARSVLVAAAHAAFIPAALRLFESHVADQILVTDSVSLRPEFTPWLSKGLRICSIAPLLARTIAELQEVP
ncbi:ribose-phosphate diphosphokinase [Peristeroidobacter soli]|jgi:ribose-phosphate pyrophosphokinase|uniref:ribose-phosphate diphosphokinase n=1 Tax=Peristeroidobacter soli TaxID=2497877 RepID=UPI00101B704A|nr:ribose-phosphate diphosphokinase [Peristeroidobacter soli]